MTAEQMSKAMLAILNDRVGARGYAGAYQFLGDALGISAEEARATVDEFEFGGVRFTKKIRIDRPGFMRVCWGVEER